AITETSLENNNDNLRNLIKPDNAPLTWVRCMVATRLAVTGSQWVDYFGKLNSGTLNNQWMVLDYKLFTPGSTIEKDTFWILEQMPNITKTKDVSEYLQNQKYWASYNIPFLPEIFNLSGQHELVKKYGNYYSHDMCPRAQIFRREQGKVADVDSMTALMRYNDYTHDPVSTCNCTPPYNAIYAIASRYDLLDPQGSYDMPNMGRRAVGATDMKLTNYGMSRSLEFIAINGPTYTNDSSVPPFQWSTSGFQDLHEGHPDKWTFGPTHHRWDSAQTSEPFLTGLRLMVNTTLTDCKRMLNGPFSKDCLLLAAVESLHNGGPKPERHDQLNAFVYAILLTDRMAVIVGNFSCGAPESDGKLMEFFVKMVPVNEDAVRLAKSVYVGTPPDNHRKNGGRTERSLLDYDFDKLAPLALLKRALSSEAEIGLPVRWLASLCALEWGGPSIRRSKQRLLECVNAPMSESVVVV
ncbi:hypothetical protein HPB47_028409, partial [Ixodes persulcatus]